MFNPFKEVRHRQADISVNTVDRFFLLEATGVARQDAGVRWLSAQ